MAFQSEIFINQAAGVPGDKYSNSPVRAQSYILQSADPAYNIIGQTMYSVPAATQGIAAAGNTGTDVFAGLLVNSKVYALRGTVAGGTLAPSLVLPNEEQAEIAAMGQFFVSLPAAAAIGDLVVYDNTTGEISTISPGAALPVGTSFGYAQVSVFIPDTVAPDSRYLAVIEMSPTFVIPV